MRALVLNPYAGKAVKLLAWVSLILAFIIGYVADQPDYLPLVKERYPDYQWTTTEVYPPLPVVYVPAPDILDEALAIVDGKGYGGPFVLGVRAYKTEDNARVSDIVVLSHKETPPYLNKLLRGKFFDQFIRKNISSDFIYGEDIDAVSGATVTAKGFTQAISTAMHKGAIDHLNLPKTWKDEKISLGLNEFLMVGLFGLVLLVVYGPRSVSRPLKIVLPFLTLAFVGFYVNASLSLGTLAGIAMGYVPDFDQHPIWWILVGGVFAGILLFGRNFYCGYLCPFDVVQGLLQKISGIKLALKPGMVKWSRTVIFTMSWFALMLIFLSRHPALGSYEPFSMMFSLKGIGIQWYILPISLLGAFLIPQFWCRLFCPVGLTLSEAVRIRQSAVLRARETLAPEQEVHFKPQVKTQKEVDSVTILYGSQTGNSRQVAHRLRATMTGNGIPATLSSMAEYAFDNLANENQVLIVCSTYGEGDPPEEAEGFYNALFSDEAPALPHLRYGVLGLGDSSYLYFCQAAVDFDARLEELGARRIIDRLDCDLDYEYCTETWITKAVDIVEGFVDTNCGTIVQPIDDMESDVRSVFHKHNPFEAQLLSRRKLTRAGAPKDFYHLELSLDGSDIVYQPGDLLGVWFENDPAEVDELLDWLSVDPDYLVEVDGHDVPVRQALVEHYELTQSHPAFLAHYARSAAIGSLTKIADDPDEARAYIGERQIIDIVREFPAAISANYLVKGLRRLSPRMYSIASSQQSVGNQVHLTLALVSYHAFGRQHYGGATGFLVNRVAEGDRVKMFTKYNPNFGLPPDPAAAAIMIGPGTGVAPFRGFLQQRRALGHTGENWLFFGNPHRDSGYLYEDEWKAHRASGLLSRVDLAFSRDQQDKVYVQHRILENAAEFYRWLERGAYVYVCGDAFEMAPDVNRAILKVIGEQGECTKEQASEYLERLRSEKRYQKDVY